MQNTLSGNMINWKGLTLRSEAPSPLNIVSSCPCEFWYDGQDTDTFTLNGANVAQWDDKSVNARHVTQAIDGQRPTYIPATGRVSFVSANTDFLQSAPFAPLVQPNTIFILYTLTGLLNVFQYAFDGVTGATQGILQSAGFFNMYAGVLVPGAGTDANDNIHVCEFNGVVSNYWMNGILVGGPANVGATNLDGITLGMHAGVLAHIDAEIMEVFGYNCLITAPERTALIAYLTTKWGL